MCNSLLHNFGFKPSLGKGLMSIRLGVKVSPSSRNARHRSEARRPVIFARQRSAACRKNIATDALG